MPYGRELCWVITPIWSDKERHEFIDWITCNPEVGDFISGSGGLRKVRWGKQGSGKRGGVRVIYFNPSVGEITLVIAYTKAKFDNLSTEFLLKLINEVSKCMIKRWNSLKKNFFNP